MSDIIQVFNLLYINTSGQIASVPQVVNFSSRDNMQLHVIHLVTTSPKVDADFKPALQVYATKFKEELTLAARETAWDAFVKLFRTVQLENSRPIGFDLRWEDEPQVLL